MLLSNSYISEDLQNRLVTRIIEKSYSNHHVTLLTYRGSGKAFEIRHILKEYPKIREVNDKRLFGWFDLDIYAENHSGGYSSSLLSFANSYIHVFDDELKNYLLHVLGKANITILDYIHALSKISSKFKISLVVEHSGRLFENGAEEAHMASNLLQILEQITPQVSMIFILDKEMPSDVSNALKKLHAYINFDVVLGKDLFFDAESVNVALKSYTEHHDLVFPKDFSEKIAPLVIGDPKTLRHIAFMSKKDNAFLSNIIAELPISEVYAIIGDSWLDERYLGIYKGLSTTSVNYLCKKGDSLTTDFLYDTGLLTSAGAYMNTLFGHFVKERYPNISSKFSLSTDLKDFLTAQELLLFEELKRNRGQVVSRDNLARVLWGDAWEDKYTDWNLDKIMSLTRKKLQQYDQNIEIKTLRGRGFMLV